MCVFLGHIHQGYSLKWSLDARSFQFCHWGGFAVDLFFILSGFILNWVYLSPSHGAINCSSYLMARIGRIMPLYYLTLALYLPIPVYSMFMHGLKYVGSDYPFTFFSNIFMVSGILNGWHFTINGPAWSISVEFFCYLALFPVLVGLYRYLVTRRYGFAAFLLIVALSIRLLVLCYRGQPIPIFHWHWDSHFLARGVFGFTAGFFLCAIYRASSRRKPHAAVINTTILASAVVLLYTQLKFLPPHLLIYALPFLVYFTAFDQGITASFLKLNPLQWLGERSYSIYLWHMPVMAGYAFLAKEVCSRVFKTAHPMGLLNCTLVILIVLMISELSYRYFEAPCRDYIRKLGSKNHSKASEIPNAVAAPLALDLTV